LQLRGGAGLSGSLVLLGRHLRHELCVCVHVGVGAAAFVGYFVGIISTQVCRREMKYGGIKIAENQISNTKWQRCELHPLRNIKLSFRPLD
jgi:hypothetical protein